MSIDAQVAEKPSRGLRVTGRFFAVFAVLVLFVSSIGLSPASAQREADEQTFITLVNQIREDEGLPPLIQDAQLTNLARSWSNSQQNGVCAGGAFICHANPISAGVTHDWQKLGENVGTGPEINAVMEAFVDSPSHFQNIVDPDFTHIGVGVVWDGNRLFTTHRFMKLANPPAPATTAAPAPTTTPPRAPATTSPTAPPATSAPATAAPAAPAQPPATSAPATAAPATPATPATPTPVAPENSVDGNPADNGTVSDDAADTADTSTETSDAPEGLANVGETPSGVPEVSVGEERAAVLVGALSALVAQ